jgi:hypothetical protein
MLQQVYNLKRRLEGTEKPHLLLDIDNTLSASRDLYFQRFSEEFGNPEELSIQEFIDKYVYTWNVPYWQGEDRSNLAKEMEQDIDLHERAELITGADEGVAAIQKRIDIAGYLTARFEVLQATTQRWLKKHSFPKGELIMRPHYIENHNQWKAEVMEFLYPEVTGIIDDNPGIIEHLSDSYKGTIYLYENTIDFQPKVNVVSCADWTHVVEKVTQSY